MKRIAAIFIALLLVLVGCGEKDEPPAGSGATDDGNAASATLRIFYRGHVFVDEKNVVRATQGFDVQQQPSVLLELDAAGRQGFEDMTRNIVGAGGGHFTILFGDEVLSQPTLDPATSPDGISADKGIEITGGFTVAEAQRIADALSD